MDALEKNRPGEGAGGEGCVYALKIKAMQRNHTAMKSDLRERTKKAVGGSLSELPPLQRLETLRQNAAFLRGGPAKLPIDDGTHVRKTVGAPS
ncbi:MAG: hypothetical protein AB8F34_09825 [Akkermansiaceae bacterium]